MTAVPNNPARETPWWKPLVWPAVIAALLGGHALLITTALLLSTALIPAASVAPSGYADALAWDDEQALRRASERLGWSLEVAPSPIADVLGDRGVEFVLNDADGAPLEGAELRVRLYHHSRPGETLEALAAPVVDRPWVYAARLRMRREGLWKLSATARLGADEFLAESDLWLTGGTP